VANCIFPKADGSIPSCDRADQRATVEPNPVSNKAMSIKNSKRFAEIEYSLQHYFEGSVLSVMKQVRKTLNAKQVKELADYQRSPAGIMASSNPMLIDMGWQAVRTAGEWNSKTTEDYLRMCNEKMQNDKAMQRD